MDRHAADGNFRGGPAHLQDMRCDTFREAISAQIDGEDPGLPGAALDAHLGACADCRAWQQRAHLVTRRARLGGLFLDHDLTSAVLAAVPAATTGRRRRFTRRAGLAAMAAAQLAITVPLLLGHDHDAGSHAAHELGSFDLALAIAFAVGVIRPALAAGLAWPCAIAASGLTGTALIDWIGGQTPGADEAQHLVAVAGALLLVWQARTNGRSAGGAVDAFPAEARTNTVTPMTDMPTRDAAALANGSPDLPGGGEAAAAPVPGVAARTGARTALAGGPGDGGTPAGRGGEEAVA
jgi:predicted anti-sigma-YlaC factor YlaD